MHVAEAGVVGGLYFSKVVLVIHPGTTPDSRKCGLKQSKDYTEGTTYCVCASVSCCKHGTILFALYHEVFTS